MAWIIKQPVGTDSTFYTYTKFPYKTASTMLNKARAVGNAATWSHASAFLQSWRARGTPVPSHTTDRSSTGLSQLTLQDSAAHSCDAHLEYAWRISHYCEQHMATVLIEYRWAMALLGRAYANKICRIEQEDHATGRNARSRHGQGPVKTRAIDSLLQLTHLPSDRKTLVKRLTRATRWYDAAKALGWGILCLMPTDIVSTRWVEKEVLAHEWSIWLELIKRVNKDAYTVSMAMDDWLGTEGIQGGAIQSKEILYIEEKGPAVVYEVEEVADSTNEDGESDVESTTQSVSSAQPLRQLTLLELFRPPQ
jgi:hypothetical protein